MPPYSVYLSDYATDGNEKLRVILIQHDLSHSVYQLRLVMTIELDGKVIMRTSRFFNPAPISLDPGVPTVIAGAELAPYVDSRNIDFVGYSKEQYNKTKALPEGSYQITFTAYDYHRQEQQVSNAGNSIYYLAKNEPPLVNFPACGTSIPLKTPQQIIFSWLPRNTSSPTSAQDTEYEFTLYETRPVGRNPNDVVLTSQPVYRLRTDYTQLIYGVTEPMLLEGMTYVWRVQAIDRNGKDAFRNNGYSQVCTFKYGGVDPDFNIGAIKGLQAIGETAYRGKISWEKGNFDSYTVFYKKPGAQWEWFSGTVDTTLYKIFDLEPNTEYEVRVQGKKDVFLSPYTDVIKFRTKEEPVPHCGDSIAPLPEIGAPLKQAFVGMTFRASGVPITVTHIESLGGGWFKGYGQGRPSEILVAIYDMKFDRLYIDENLEAGDGEIYVISRGVAAMADEQLAAQKKRKDEESTKNANNNVIPFDGTVIAFEGVIDSANVNDQGQIIVSSVGIDKTYKQEVDPKTGEKVPMQIKDNVGNVYEIDGSGNIKKTSSKSDSSEAILTANSNSQYFISIPNDTTKYRNKADLTFIKYRGKVVLTLKGHPDSLVSKLIWKVDGKETCKGVASCDISLSSDGSKSVEVLLNKKAIIQVNVNVYKSPVIIFDKPLSYAGEFGFDDGHKFSQLRGDYELLNIGNSKYYVSWLSLKDKQTVNLRLDVNSLAKAASKDKNFKVIFKSSDSTYIKINNLNSVSFSYTQLSTTANLSITATAYPSVGFDTLSAKTIFAYDQKNQLIGKLRVLCKPLQNKRIVFVYVNHGTGYRTVLKSDLLDFLNTQSHNQFFRNWILETAYSDTMDISGQYKTNSSPFTLNTTVLPRLAANYILKKGINPTTITSTYFFFISSLTVLRADGVTQVGGKMLDNIGGIFNGGNFEEIAHELGHGLGLEHTFPEASPQTTFPAAKMIPQGTTKNYMDYISSGRNMFFWYQWPIVK